jgi:hypothetical protein
MRTNSWRLGLPGAVLLALALTLILMSSSGVAAASRAITAVPARTPVAQVLGLGLGMPEARVHRTLARIGRRSEAGGEPEGEGEEEGESLERELWVLDDRRYASVLVVFDEEKRLRAVQAYLKPGGRGLRYRDLGDLRGARRLGYTIWQWDVPPGPNEPGRRVVARGVDSVYAGSVSLTPLH